MNLKNLKCLEQDKNFDKQYIFDKMIYNYEKRIQIKTKEKMNLYIKFEDKTGNIH